MAERPDADGSGDRLERGAVTDRERLDGQRMALSGWRLWTPVAFILISLVALFVVPTLVGSRIQSLRNVLENRIQPARELLDDVVLSFSREAATIRSYLLTGSPRTAEQYARIRQVTVQQLDQLERVAAWPETGPERSYLNLVAQVEAWHATHDALLTGRITPDEYRRIAPPEEPVYEDILQTAAGLEVQIAAYEGAILAQVEATNRLGSILSIGLALLALVSALVLIAIQRRLRELTRYLERRAREEEALREAASLLSAPGSVDETLERIVSSTLHTIRPEGAVVERLDPERGVLTVASSGGSLVPEVGATGPIEGSVAQRALETGGPVQIDGLGAFRSLLTEHAQCDRCTVLVVPLAEGGEAFGALLLVRAPDGPGFDHDDVADAQILGDLASLAFRKATALEASERARRDLESAMESRARLVRGFSHDVKNPLGAADGYLELLEIGLKGELTDSQKESVAHSRRSIRSALELIEELVELARAEAGQLALRREAVDLSAMANEATEAYRAKIESAGLTLEGEIDSALPPVTGDPDRIGQILSNLISNAVNYTPEGGRVTIRTRRCNAPAEADRPPRRQPGSEPAAGVCIDVIDTGPGIPEDKREAIFEEFTRLAPEAGRGTGLGLAISRRLARLMGGDLTVESEVGRGSTFTLWLPIEAEDRAARPAA